MTDLGQRRPSAPNDAIAKAPVGGTEPASLTGEGDEAIVATCVAVDAQKAMSQHAALEVGADLALDEASDRRPRRLRPCDEGCELFTNDAMKESVLGLVAFVANRGVVAGTGLVLSLLSKRCAAWGGGDGHDSPCPLCISPLVRCRAIKPSRSQRICEKTIKNVLYDSGHFQKSSHGLSSTGSWTDLALSPCSRARML